MRDFSKRCGCGCRYDAGAWQALPLVGHQVDDVACLEMRDCVCGSTLAVEVDDFEPGEMQSDAEYRREVMWGDLQ